MAQVSFTVTFNISPAGLSVVNPDVTVSGVVGQPLTAALGINVQGGTPPYAFAVSSGSLPEGLSMDGSGNISGTPTAPGQTTATVSVTDSGA